MPIYEYDCSKSKCGRFELIRPYTESDEKAKCPHCGKLCSRVPSLPVMRPDALWAGKVDASYGYFTSAAKLKQEMKRRNHVTIGDRTDREGMDKVAEKAAEAREENNKKRIRDWAERAFGPSGLGLGGADGEKMIKDANLK